MPIIAVFGIDVVLTIVFAAIGRASHKEGIDPAEVLQTAWPFLVGLVLGWLITRLALHRFPRSWRDAWPVWLVTVAIAMALRKLTGEGTAVAFIIVATITLGVLLLGWRLLSARWLREPARP